MAEKMEKDTSLKSWFDKEIEGRLKKKYERMLFGLETIEGLANA